MDKKYMWVNSYEKIANKVLEFKDNRSELLNIMYDMLTSAGKFSEGDITNCNLDKYNDKRVKYDDIDPFSFLNRFDIYADDTRKELMKIFSEKTNISMEIPETLNGIPSVNPLSSCFLAFKDDRKEEDSDHYWNFFEVALKFADGEESLRGDFINLFNKLLKKPNVKYNLTSALYKIRPNFYISLDQVNRNYLRNKLHIDIRVAPSGEEYLNLINEIKAEFNTNGISSIPDFSYKAWLEAQELKQKQKENKKWSYEDYDPGLSKEKWIELINDKNIFDIHSLKIMKRFLDYGGEATCSEIATQYGQVVGYYNLSASNTGRRVVEKTNIIPPVDTGASKWWPVLFVGRYTEKEEMGLFLWKIREPLKEALEEVDLSDIPLYEDNILNKNYINDIINLNEIFVHEDLINKILRVLDRKQNIILQGVPGVGKTFIIESLIKSEYKIFEDESNIETVQFHQSYSYEEFIEGYRPLKDGKFEIVDGIFKQFSDKALKDPENDYFFVIDEINRGNLSKIFGELLMLIEKDKRSKLKVRLPYSKDEFSIPKNLFIIGTMNTADRSLSLVDYALRRRFSFITLKPAFNTEKFNNYVLNVLNYKPEELNLINKIMSDINKEISIKLKDTFEIGHSYFIEENRGDDFKAFLNEIFEYEILPLLEEYFFDDESQIQTFKEMMTIDE